jgi:PTS system ascorbate-specific IIA component
MIGILIIAHGALGESLIQCATHVMGARPDQVRSLEVTSRADPDLLLAEARGAIAALDAGEGVLVLTDICGGTPSNVATRTVESGRVEALAGVNLPMLIRALTYRGQSLSGLVAKAVSGGRDGVCNLGAECPTSGPDGEHRHAAG